MFKRVDTKDVREAQERSGHDFTVEMIPLITVNGDKVWDKQGVIRKDNGKYLGTVGYQTTHLQPDDFYAMAGELLAASDGKIERTFTMGNGAIIGICFTFDRREYVPEDDSTHNLIFMTSYNSSFAVNAKAFNFRFVCLNMLGNSTKLFSIKNTTNNLPRLKVATNLLKYYHIEMKDFDQKMRLLTRHGMSDQEAIEWFGTKLLKAPKPDNERANTIFDNQLDMFIGLLKDGKGTNIPGVRGTAYGVLNAITEYYNHHRGTRIRGGKSEEEVRFTSNILGGSSDKMMQKALFSLVNIATKKGR